MLLTMKAVELRRTCGGRRYSLWAVTLAKRKPATRGPIAEPMSPQVTRTEKPRIASPVRAGARMIADRMISRTPSQPPAFFLGWSTTSAMPSRAAPAIWRAISPQGPFRRPAVMVFS